MAPVPKMTCRVAVIPSVTWTGGSAGCVCSDRRGRVTRSHGGCPEHAEDQCGGVSPGFQMSVGVSDFPARMSRSRRPQR